MDALMQTEVLNVHGTTKSAAFVLTSLTDRFEDSKLLRGFPCIDAAIHAPNFCSLGFEVFASPNFSNPSLVTAPGPVRLDLLSRHLDPGHFFPVLLPLPLRSGVGIGWG
jgi:hypothetical protein